MWAAFLAWLRDNQVGDLTGVAGLVLSLVGFAATLFNVHKSRTAAERAEAAARSARDGIRLFDTVVDFTAAIAMLEDIRRGHRQEQWLPLLERYAAIRKVLVTLDTANQDLTTEQRAAVRSALANLIAIERKVEQDIGNPERLRAARFNRVVSRDIDRLLTTLVEIKIARAGVDS